MKCSSYIKVIILINIALLSAGCGEDNPTESSSSQSLILEGKMLDWTSGADKLLMFGEWACRRDETFSHGSVASDGSFKIIVTQPPPNLRPVLELIAGQNCDGYVTFSDSTVKFFKGEPVLFDGNKFLGSILWTDVLSSNPNPDYWEYYKEVYYYFNKDVAVTGRGIVSGETGTAYGYDFTAKAGWNKLLLHYESSDLYLHTLINEKSVNGKYLFNGGLATTD
ncbi:MAG TPA: hypothetical protein VHP30_07890 [Ignavibacteriales bacterium]|nr:hypothetical protein [Ignavibacteriales bacterium]